MLELVRILARSDHSLTMELSAIERQKCLIMGKWCFHDCLFILIESLSKLLVASTAVKLELV